MGEMSSWVSKYFFWRASSPGRMSTAAIVSVRARKSSLGIDTGGEAWHFAGKQIQSIPVDSNHDPRSFSFGMLVHCH